MCDATVTLAAARCRRSFGQRERIKKNRVEDPAKKKMLSPTPGASLFLAVECHLSPSFTPLCNVAFRGIIKLITAPWNEWHWVHYTYVFWQSLPRLSFSLALIKHESGLTSLWWQERRQIIIRKQKQNTNKNSRVFFSKTTKLERKKKKVYHLTVHYNKHGAEKTWQEPTITSPSKKKGSPWAAPSFSFASLLRCIMASKAMKLSLIKYDRRPLNFTRYSNIPSYTHAKAINWKPIFFSYVYSTHSYDIVPWAWGMEALFSLLGNDVKHFLHVWATTQNEQSRTEKKKWWMRDAVGSVGSRRETVSESFQFI